MADVLRLKKSNCKNCYKCIRHCPVKAIRFSGNQAHIVSDDCILCGQCFVVCPQNAKEIVDAKEYVKVLLAGDKKVIASVAPSFAAYFEKSGIDSLEEALKKLGFFAAEESCVWYISFETENLRRIFRFAVCTGWRSTANIECRPALDSPAP